MELWFIPAVGSVALVAAGEAHKDVSVRLANSYHARTTHVLKIMPAMHDEQGILSGWKRSGLVLETSEAVGGTAAHDACLNEAEC